MKNLAAHTGKLQQALKLSFKKPRFLGSRVVGFYLNPESYTSSPQSCTLQQAASRDAPGKPFQPPFGDIFSLCNCKLLRTVVI